MNDVGDWHRSHLEQVLPYDFIELLTNIHCSDDALGMDSAA